jgi:cytochrome c551
LILEDDMKKVRWMTLMVVVLLVVLLSACSSGKNSDTDSDAGDVAKPSNSGGAGEAVNLTGDAAAGAQVFQENCIACHGEQGKGGVANPGSEDGTVPPLNPIDATLKNSDGKIYATNIDLFIEHGSTPAGDAPTLVMAAFGDQKTLTPQQIADVIAYIISLNK